MPASRRLLAVALVLALAAAACARGSSGDADRPGSGDGQGGTGTGGTDSTGTGNGGTAPGPPPTKEALDRLALRWQQVTTAKYPTAVAFRAPRNTMYVAERDGTVRMVRDGQVVDPPALDLTGDVGVRGEGGLLGIAFSNDGGTLFVHYTDKATDSRVLAFAMAGDTADAGTRRDLFSLDQPTVLHNGGGMVVDANGHLWIGFGDGGDRGAGRRVAQDLNSLFGKLVRVDPRPAGGQPYQIPPGNPFAGREGARPEIWAYGLRNPWRFSIDRATGDVWIGDVGEHGAEEVDYLPAGRAGANFGWPAYEGTKRFTGPAPAEHVPPLKVIAHRGEICAVTGGYVYRGKAIRGLAGAYVYADVCTGEWSLLSQEGGKVVAERDMGRLWDQLVSFGEDADGELYAMSLVGQVWKLVPG